MGMKARPYFRSAITLLAVTGTVAVTLAASTAGVASASSGDGTTVTHTYSSAQQSAAASYWSPSVMSHAAGVSDGTVKPSAVPAPPATIPNPVYFNGIKTVGALFFTTDGGQDHFCTASVVNSATLNLVLTAAHCVAYGDDTFAQDVVYVPEWHNGVSPYGAWPVENITVTSSWDQNQNDINADFAFLKVGPPAGTSRPIQLVTGGLTLGSYLGYNHKNISVIGYNNTDSQPIICDTNSVYGDIPDQELFYCNNYNDGTSGGPWIIGLNQTTGSGVVFGDIGGYDQGGDYPYYSYSSYYDATIDFLYAQAQASQL
jgi:V8-like Glu-specific endopeptidase